jgi:arylsulfatase A-like enzyme
MRVLYIDVDSLRPDHLGCYGYPRATSPNIDAIAKQGVRFTNTYVSDVPCLPSRTAMFSGRFGVHTGVVNHGGSAADPFIEGASRGQESLLGQTSWMSCLRQVGMKTATISSFAERHSAWHFLAGFSEVINPGLRGRDSAEQVAPLAIDWLQHNGKSENWFLHVNFWDPHTPYRAPAEAGDPFAGTPTPSWLTDAVRKQHWTMAGPHGAQEINGFDAEVKFERDYPRQPMGAMDSMDKVRQMFDGYDTAVWWADQHIGQIIRTLEKLGIAEQTAIVITADHGENLGELNVYGDHQTADAMTCRVPLIVKWPGVTDKRAGKTEGSLNYQFDFAATTIELLGGRVPGNWDGLSFASEFREGGSSGRDYLVCTQGAWAIQRGIIFPMDNRLYLCIRTHHGAFHAYPDVSVYDLVADPFEQKNLAGGKTNVVDAGLHILDQWRSEMMRTSSHAQDPIWTVWHEGGPLYTRGRLPEYLKRLRATGRAKWADFLTARYPAYLKGQI